MPPKRTWRPIILHEVAAIPLSRGLWAWIDTADLPLVVGYSWSAWPDKNTFYARSSTGLKLHRIVLGLAPGDPLQADHINGNGLDNRRNNLRRATAAQNVANRSSRSGATSRYKGVCWSKQHKTWKAQITVDGRQTFLGLFGCEEDAARAYDDAAVGVHGEYARINLPT